jgi:NADPH-dependent 2,4-dienoyl-CoA reductase/sulfur reductase-like enzyme
VHQDRGVVLRFGVSVAALVEGEPGRVAGVRLTDGDTVPADVVVVGIGVSPSTDWLNGSGLEVRDGVVCDATLNAGADGVFAAGDVCRWFNGTFDREMRVEHWSTAAEQGAAAARNLVAWSKGEPLQPYTEVPFFWSDQFTAKIQFVGRVEGGEEVRVVAGSPEERAFVALYGREGRLVGALGVSKPRLLMQFRKVIGERMTFDDGVAFAASLVAN